MGILEMDFERILGVTFFISSFHSIMLWPMFFHDIFMKIDELLVKAEVYEVNIRLILEFLKDFDPLRILYMLEQFSTHFANFFA